MKHKQKNKHQYFLKRIIRWSIGTGITLFICYFATVWLARNADDIEDWFAVQRTSQGLPAAQQKFDVFYDRVVSVSDDTPLETSIHQPGVPSHNYTGCIKSYNTIIYGTQRPFSDVLADYASAFEGLDWDYRELLIATNDTWFIYDTDTTSVQIDFISDELADDQEKWQSYTTVYEVEFQYAEPSISHCWG